MLKKFLFKRACLRALRHESSLAHWQYVSVANELVRLSNQSRSTKPTTRCRVTGRTRQVFRNIQLARMEFRRAMREGSMLGLKLGRS